MKRITLLVIFAFVGCKTAKVDREYKEVYFREFKTVYFKALLREGFNKSKSYDAAVKIDQSHFAEPILSASDFSYIDSLAVIGNNFMMKDSLESYERKAEGASGKMIFYYALDRYTSKWLDSICSKRFDLNQKVQN